MMQGTSQMWGFFQQTPFSSIRLFLNLGLLLYLQLSRNLLLVVLPFYKSVEIFLLIKLGRRISEKGSGHRVGHYG